jgi:acylphosphatase
MPVEPHVEKYRAYLDFELKRRKISRMPWWKQVIEFFSLPDDGRKKGKAHRIHSARIHVKGKVKDVNFETHALRIANEVGLKGSLAFLPDDTVEMVVSGTPYQIKEMHDWSMVGPGTAFVTTSECEMLKKVVSFDKFSIPS